VNARADPSFQIVQVNLQADRGGDGRVVTSLHERYRALGYPASLLVGRGSLPVEGGRLLPSDAYRSRWARAWLARDRKSAASEGTPSDYSKLLSWIAEPNRRRRIHSGYEDFQFPATFPVISEAIRKRQAILHLHNLHGGYFDLRTLPALSAVAPLVLTLHDQWMFTGHCAHSFECDRWKIGCGDCPDLRIYPAIPKDRTAENFLLKQEIFSRTRINLATPSQWLMDKTKNSLLATSIDEARVIPSGVDTRIFRQGSKEAERSRLGLPQEARIVLCAGTAVRSSHWTDKQLFDATTGHLAARGIDCALLLLGSGASSESRIGGIRVIHRGYEQDPSRVASYYRASDVYLHPARADTFPTAVVESLACGTPVVATDVGGIPEQVRSLWASSNAPLTPPTSATGILVDGSEKTSAGRAVEMLLQDDDLRALLGQNGSDTAVSEYSINRQAQRYLDWYQEILSRRERDGYGGQGKTSRTRGRPR
jgi:glycosyltransferase involved in cell wall biosynthesis